MQFLVSTALRAIWHSSSGESVHRETISEAAQGAQIGERGLTHPTLVCWWRAFPALPGHEELSWVYLFKFWPHHTAGI